jgi:TonB-dependent SusC/RagA subfamily outer membrane receptor
MKTKIFFLLIVLLPAISISAQKANKKITVTGFVKDAAERPIEGAMILIDGKITNIGTKEDGSYKVKVKPDADSLTVLTYFNGISTVAIAGRNTINFTFSGSALQNQNDLPGKGDEEVNIGYGSVKKKDLMGPVNKVDGTESKYASYRTVYDMLRGQPGVQVNGTSVKIQGTNSIMLSSDPLFVVDGAVVSSLEDVQPFMVKSIEILKGSSASIYGSRGANGVILITLKK